MNARPLVSILINNYNYARYLDQAIDSALAQIYDKVEVVVVDDGSTDGSLEIIANYGNQIVAVAKANGGQASAYNAGFAASHGEVICLLDADDLFLPQKVSSVVEAYENNPEIGWCFDLVREFSDNTGLCHPRPPSYVPGRCDARASTAAGKQPAVRTASSGLSFRREILARILPMPEVIRITSDNYIKHAALALAAGWMVAEELSWQRLHSDNAYTKRMTGKERLVGRTQLLTGIFLHARHPSLHRLGRNIFCRGLGRLWATGGIDTECRELMVSFLRPMTFPVKSEVLMRAAYWRAWLLFNPR
jgi:glycosyltransferase involved in cell wall biosynthesis